MERPASVLLFLQSSVTIIIYTDILQVLERLPSSDLYAAQAGVSLVRIDHRVGYKVADHSAYLGVTDWVLSTHLDQCVHTKTHSASHEPVRVRNMVGSSQHIF